MNRFGLTASQLENVSEILRKVLGGKESYAVWVFGSRARSDQKPFSDIDLLIECRPTLTDKEKADLEDRFESGDLPYKVDLVRENEVFPAYAGQIEQEKSLLIRSTGKEG